MGDLMAASMRARKGWAAAALTLVVAAGGYAVNQLDIEQGSQPAAAAPPALETSVMLQASLQMLPVVEPVDVPGYDRSCSPGAGCSFGPAWSDDTSAPLARNGCDTRNDILRTSLANVTLRPGTNGCVVESGLLLDPYTGEQVEFSRSQGSEVHIDHLVPLAYAWRHGAAGWPQEKRAAFANDPANLRPTQGSVNQAKGDSGPGEWMPVVDQCGYATAFATVAVDYGLSITAGDRDVLASACPV